MLHCSLCPTSALTIVRVRPKDSVVFSEGSVAVVHSLQENARDPVL